MENFVGELTLFIGRQGDEQDHKRSVIYIHRFITF